MEISTLLTELLTALNDFNADEAVYYAHLLKQHQTRNKETNFVNLPLQELFIGFQLGNEELSMVLADLIWEAIKDEDFPAIYHQFSAQIIQGLNPNLPVCNKLCLKILFLAGIEKGHQIDHETLNSALSLLISTRDYSISSLLIGYLKSSRTFKEDSFVQEQLLQLYEQAKDDSVLQFRFFELFTALHMTQLNRTFFDELKSILFNAQSDNLIAANALQTIQDSINTPEQFQMFLSEGIVDQIISLMESSASALLSCKSLDLIAHLSLLNCFTYADFIEPRGIDRKSVYACDKSETEASAVFCCAALATLSPSPQRLLANFGGFLKHGVTEVQLAALHGVGVFFSSNGQNEQLKVDLLIHLQGEIDFFKYILDRINSTFDEQKSAAYFALKSVISSPACFKAILNSSTIFSFILQRDLDSSLIGLKWKYGIVDQIYARPDLFSCLNEPLQIQVKKYLGQGVVFVPKSSRVAFEAE